MVQLGVLFTWTIVDPHSDKASWRLEAVDSLPVTQRIGVEQRSFFMSSRFFRPLISTVDFYTTNCLVRYLLIPPPSLFTMASIWMSSTTLHVNTTLDILPRNDWHNSGCWEFGQMVSAVNFNKKLTRWTSHSPPWLASFLNAISQFDCSAVFSDCTLLFNITDMNAGSQWIICWEEKIRAIPVEWEARVLDLVRVRLECRLKKECGACLCTVPKIWGSVWDISDALWGNFCDEYIIWLYIINSEKNWRPIMCRCIYSITMIRIGTLGNGYSWDMAKPAPHRNQYWIYTALRYA